MNVKIDQLNVHFFIFIYMIPNHLYSQFLEQALIFGVSIHKVAKEKLHKHMASFTSGISLDAVQLPRW